MLIFMWIMDEKISSSWGLWITKSYLPMDYR